MLWERANSSNIDKVGFDPTNGELQVMFRSGATYRYMPVPQAVYDAFKETGFSGRFLNAEIKPIYSYERL